MFTAEDPYGTRKRFEFCQNLVRGAWRFMAKAGVRNALNVGGFLAAFSMTLKRLG